MSIGLPRDRADRSVAFDRAAEGQILYDRTLTEIAEQTVAACIVFVFAVIAKNLLAVAVEGADISRAVAADSVPTVGRRCLLAVEQEVAHQLAVEGPVALDCLGKPRKLFRGGDKIVNLSVDLLCLRGFLGDCAAPNIAALLHGYGDRLRRT